MVMKESSSVYPTMYPVDWCHKHIKRDDWASEWSFVSNRKDFPYSVNYNDLTSFFFSI